MKYMKAMMETAELEVEEVVDQWRHTLQRRFIA